MANGNSRLKKPILIHKNRKQAAMTKVLRGPQKLRRRKRTVKKGNVQWA